ncbi:UNC93-like protein [Ctenocephalides felis]|uniref:UNC93-like protein n=1 Tax=Ctenocephalides felis TaxID=7515 RepID=UPI000E6E13F6|nr:UNC93-like protein [Ctenocephalides felis]
MKYYEPAEKWRILKNVCIVSIAFMIHFTAFMGAANLQSSINASAGLGTASLATIYGSLVLSNLFLPVLMIGWLGCKWTMAVSFITYMPYIAAQFGPSFGTMIPAALCVGFGGGPLWCAKCTYLTVLAAAYAKITDGKNSEALVVRFFGLFFMIFQFSQIWGNLISSIVLSSGTDSQNITIDPDALELCGANFLPGQAISTGNTNLEPPSPEKIYTIAGIYLACMVTACLIVALFVDSSDRYESNRKGSGTGLQGFQLLAITIKLLKVRWQILMVPITMLLGMSQTFIGADFTAAYVSCAWGISNIGYVMICYGACNAISAIVLGWLVKITGRMPIICSAAILHTMIAICLLTWKPNAEYKIIYFIISGAWGLVDGVWLVQINAFCGILFPGREEAAYSNFRLWEAVGSIVTYGYSTFLRTDIKLYILLLVIWIGIVGYVTTELSIKKTQTKNTKL